MLFVAAQFPTGNLLFYHFSILNFLCCTSYIYSNYFNVHFFFVENIYLFLHRASLEKFRKLNKINEIEEFRLLCAFVYFENNNNFENKKLLTAAFTIYLKCSEAVLRHT